MIPVDTWRQITPPEFEALALEHVRSVYPDFSWRSTSLTLDGGKDAVGELRNLQGEIAEMYWMEAKHHPTNQSIGKYTLDTHLVSAFLSHGVRRLHVVTSGKLSDTFLVRADVFSKEHGFVFAYTDQMALEAWLASRPDIVRSYFHDSASDVLLTLGTIKHANNRIFASGIFIPDNDNVSTSAVPATHLLPGRKFRLVVVTSLATGMSSAVIPFRLKWDVPPQRVGLLMQPDADNSVISFDPVSQPIVTVPFRLLLFSRTPLPPLIIEATDGTIIAQVPLRAATELPRLTSPFVGATARTELLGARRLLQDCAAASSPRLVICLGRAGAGKTRFAEELRDDATLLSYSVRTVEMTSSPRSQEELWRRLFRWIFGMECNPFELPEDELIGRHLTSFDLDIDSRREIHAALKAFLVDGIYSEDLFNLDLATGRHFVDVLQLIFQGRSTHPVLLHIDDAHHVLRPQLRPLYLLRHLIETGGALPVVVLVTGRNDETVRDRSFEHFVVSLDLTGSRHTRVIELPDLSNEDAEELVATTLRWPELRADESKTLAMILDRAGTNPFLLMQVLDHLAIEHQTVAFGHGEGYFLIDVPRFKRALAEVPRGVRHILAKRFEGLVRRGEANLLLALAGIAVVGRRAPRRLLRRVLTRPLSDRQAGRLLALGYLTDFSSRDVELVHDLLVDALRELPEARQAAVCLAKSIGGDATPLLTDDQQASIYYAAGPRYYRNSWNLTKRIVEDRSRRQEYLGLPPLFTRLEQIASRTRGVVVDARVAWLAAIAEQHCGNTDAALRRFQNIRRAAETNLPLAMHEYLNSTIEIANQHYLRAEPTDAIANVNTALELMKDPRLPVAAPFIAQLRALAHNRLGAALHLIGRAGEAQAQFAEALAAALVAGDDYLTAHTHWNLAALLRFRLPAKSHGHLQTARTLWSEKLRHKERLRIMIDCSEAYSEYLELKSLLARTRLLAVAAGAFEKGYFVQTTDALLCLASGDLAEHRWVDARRVLLRALDLATVSEDLKNKMFISHYLSICAHMLGADAECRDWCWQALGTLTDTRFNRSPVGMCLQYNQSVSSCGTVEPTPKDAASAGRLRWHRFDRA